MENTDNLKSGSLDAKKDHVPALRGDLALGKEIIPNSPFSRRSEDFIEFRPQGIEVDLLLIGTPRFKSVGPNRTKV